MRRYLSAHWRGELSLARSFWLNLVALDVGLALLYAGLHWGLRPLLDPNLILVPIVMLSVLQLLAITPWQIVGAFPAPRAVIASGPGVLSGRTRRKGCCWWHSLSPACNSRPRWR